MKTQWAFCTKKQKRKGRIFRTSLLLCLGLFLSTADAKTPTSSQESNASIKYSVLRAELFPKKHLIKLNAMLRIHWKQPQTKLRLFMSQLLQVQRVLFLPGSPPTKLGQDPDPKRSAKLLQTQRQLETLDVLFPQPPPSHFRIQVVYKIVFFAKKNYLYKRMFCQIEQGDTYFMHGWYPSLRPFADTVSGQLLGGERFRYRLHITVPQGERAIAAGNLLHKIPRPRNRTEFVFQDAPVQEAALFLTSGRFRKLVWSKDSRTQVTFYLQPKDANTNINRLGPLVAKAQAFYERLWGSPMTRVRAASQTSKRERGKNQTSPSKKHHWKIISFSGSGARGYPFSLFLDRREGFFQGSLDGMMGFFTRRQVILHELAHTWWGNALTGVGKASRWLNEGITNYASLKALGALYGKQAERRAFATHLRFYLKSRGKGGLLDTGGIAQLAQLTAYTKGALVFYELEREIGAAQVARGFRQLFQQYRGKFVNKAQVRQVFEAVSKRSLTNFFRQWIDGHELPLLRLRSWKCKTQTATSCRLEIRLNNLGPLPGHAHVLVHGKDPKQTRELWFRIPANQPKRILRNIPFAVKDVQWNPHQLMLHGFRWQALLQEANNARQDEEFDKAHKAYTLLLQRIPNHGHALYGMGRLLEVQEKYAQAATYYRQAEHTKSTETTPLWVRSWARFRQATLLARKGQMIQAKTIFHQLLRSKDNPYQLHQRIQITLRAWTLHPPNPQR